MIQAAVIKVNTGSAHIQLKNLISKAAMITPTEDKVSAAICKKVALILRL